MSLIEFLKPTQSNSERCLHTLYFIQFAETQSSASSKIIRDRLYQARIPKAKSINVSDCLGKAGHHVDFKMLATTRSWFLTKSGIKAIEEKVLSRTGAPPAFARPKQHTSNTKLEILFLGLDPANEERLRLGEETREIEAKLRASEFRDSFNFKSKWATRPADLFQYLHESKPHVVHLSGHGATCGGIAFEDSSGCSKLVSPEALGQAFATMKDNIKVVVLNACHSNLAAIQVALAIDCAVGMSDAINDKSAIQFSASFYSSLGSGHSVLRAFREARAALVMEGLPGDHLLRLHTRAEIDPDQIFLVAPE